MEGLTRLDDLREAIAALDAGRMGTAEVGRLIRDALANGLLTSNQAFWELRSAGDQNASAKIIADLQLEITTPWERIASLLAARTGTVDQQRVTETRLADRASVSAAPLIAPRSQTSLPKMQSAGVDRLGVDPGAYAARPAERNMIGQILGSRYRLERELGAGFIGIEYLAADLDSNEDPYVITLVRPEFRSFSDSLALMRTEVRVARMLRHPHIARVHSLITDRLGVYLVTEYLEGRTLEAQLREMSQGLPLTKACQLVAELGAALAYAHELDVVHGDVQPANVFVTQSDRAKILNFGLARAAGTRNGRFDPRRLGGQRLAYASAEMLEGQAPDRRDDVYSMGCIIYSVLSGGHPFESRTAVEARSLGLAMPPLRSLSRNQNAALAQALAFARHERTSSVTELLGDLGWAADSQGSALPAAGLPPVPATESAGPEFSPESQPTAATATPFGGTAESLLPSIDATPRPPPASPTAARRYLMPLLLVLTVLLVAAGIALVWTRQAATSVVTLRSRPTVSAAVAAPPSPSSIATSSAPIMADSAPKTVPEANPVASPQMASPQVMSPQVASAPAVADSKYGPGAVIPLIRPLPKAAAAMANGDNCPYPQAAVDQGLTGTVVLLVYVTPDGKPTKTKVAKTSGSAVLDEAATRCIEQFGRFPDPSGGESSGYWGHVRFTWSFGT